LIHQFESPPAPCPLPPKFRIKICGITNVEDATAAVDAGADAIGLNFYGGSKRFIEPRAARRIVDAAGREAEMVGVFVNEPASTICEIANNATLRTIQLHGEKWPNLTHLLVGFGVDSVSIIRAHSFGPRGLDAVYESIFFPCGMAADSILVDASVAGMHGGTGQTINWNALVNYEQAIGKVPLILAGGLTPDNVAEAIRIVQPHAVDVASGVESAPGKKDPHKVRDFIAAAKAAFDSYR
jgi:phosphoribosylanthranilate isomerase